MMQMPDEIFEKIKLLKDRIASADRILLGAGAGLSAAAGLSYFNEAVFKKYFPEMAARGYHVQYELVGMADDDWTVGRKWAYWATHVNYVRNIFQPAPLYAELLSVLQGHDWFVVTSNADRQFYRSGFPMERVFEYQGSYDNMGCSQNCCGHTWSSLGPLKHVFENIHHESFECPPEALPRCPYCGALAEMCFRGENYDNERRRYIDFVNGSDGKRLCLIEIGVGFNTPGVIRWPFERITKAIPASSLFRINRGYRDYPGHRGYPEIPPAIASRAWPIDWDAAEVIHLLKT